MNQGCDYISCPMKLYDWLARKSTNPAEFERVLGLKYPKNVYRCVHGPVPPPEVIRQIRKRRTAPLPQTISCTAANRPRSVRRRRGSDRPRASPAICRDPAPIAYRARRPRSTAMPGISVIACSVPWLVGTKLTNPAGAAASDAIILPPCQGQTRSGCDLGAADLGAVIGNLICKPVPLLKLFASTIL